jgi:3-hydroxyisobutyrate dehydrogenase
VKLAFIGLGVMGFPMAGHLARAGHAVTVFNRTPAKASAWAETCGGSVAATPAAAADGADAVFACVGADDDLREVTLGPDGAFAAMRPGALFADHTTVSAKIARELAARDRRVQHQQALRLTGGGQAGAESGQLSIMCGGSTAAFAMAEPIIAAYARLAVHIGEAGAGQLAKMVNQIAIAGLVQGLAEAINFAQAAGLDTARVIEAVSGGAAGSWQMHNRAATMADGRFDFGFAVDWMRKDLGLALDEARVNGAPLPVAALVDQFYADVQAMGGRRQDTSSLIRRLQPPR